VANLVALVITTLFNTEANRRFTFGGPRASTGRARAHLQGFAVFCLYYLFTSGALLALHVSDPDPPRLLELSVLLISSALGTAGRFLLLRSWVFRPDKDKDQQ
jgi:putative flippase GtrA